MPTINQNFDIQKQCDNAPDLFKYLFILQDTVVEAETLNAEISCCSCSHIWQMVVTAMLKYKFCPDDPVLRKKSLQEALDCCGPISKYFSESIKVTNSLMNLLEIITLEIKNEEDKINLITQISNNMCAKMNMPVDSSGKIKTTMLSQWDTSESSISFSPTDLNKDTMLSSTMENNNNQFSKIIGNFFKKFLCR